MERRGVLPTTKFAYRLGLGTCDAHFVCPILCKVHFRVGRGIELCSLILAQILIGFTIRDFSVSSVLWILEVLYCPY